MLCIIGKLLSTQFCPDSPFFDRLKIHNKIDKNKKKQIFLYVFTSTATLNEFFMLWRVRKKVSIPLKAPEAPLFEYVN